MLCKCSGKYIDIYFILKITFFFNFRASVGLVTCRILNSGTPEFTSKKLKHIRVELYVNTASKSACRSWMSSKSSMFLPARVSSTKLEMNEKAIFWSVSLIRIRSTSGPSTEP